MDVNKSSARLANDAVISKLCNNIDIAIDNNVGKIPYYFVVKKARIAYITARISSNFAFG